MLENVPLNTDKVYVMGTTANGCEVYVPIMESDDEQSKKSELQEELNEYI